MGRIKNTILEERYEREREEDVRTEQECIKMIGDINKKIDIIMGNVHICSDQIRLANENITLLLDQHKQLKKKNMRKNILLFLGGICGVASLYSHYKK